MKRNIRTIIACFVLLALVLSGCNAASDQQNNPGRQSNDPIIVPTSEPSYEPSLAVPWDGLAVPVGPGRNGEEPNTVIQAHTGPLSEQAHVIPTYTGEAYTVMNENHPYFQEKELSLNEFEVYSELDSLGRCGPAFANISLQSMPTEERGPIGQVKPSGWHTVKYDCVDGKYLYNRCHLIGYQLAGENANVANLITGTRYLNMEGMLPFENMVADYVKETGYHVAYRVTPAFVGNNLLVSGVLMEGYSVEDQGSGICFCIFAHNVQPGVIVDYATGNSQLDDGNGTNSDTNAVSIAVPPTTDVVPANTQPIQEPEETNQIVVAAYIANTSTKKFHIPSCSSVGQINEVNKWKFNGSADELIQQGYVPCKRCIP